MIEAEIGIFQHTSNANYFEERTLNRIVILMNICSHILRKIFQTLIELILQKIAQAKVEKKQITVACISIILTLSN